MQRLLNDGQRMVLSLIHSGAPAGGPGPRLLRAEGRRPEGPRPALKGPGRVDTAAGDPVRATDEKLAVPILVLKEASAGADFSRVPVAEPLIR